jgi:hypothetical protein
MRAASAAVFAVLLVGRGASGEMPAARFAEVIRLEANGVPSLYGATTAQLGVFACRSKCEPIPWQLDERDASGRLVLDQGPEPNTDDPPDVLDGNDLILFMASDAGERLGLVPGAPALPRGVVAAVEVELTDPRTARHAWVYVLRFADSAPRSPISYVRYDPLSDHIRGARVALGFTQGTPRFLARVGPDGQVGENLLDRMKIRARARFLWGLFSFTRSEDDVQTRFVAWRQGPIRVVRRQQLWVRLGWGFRTPIFGSDTYFYRDWADLPVTLRLNFAPHVLFTDVTIRAVLDFRDLHGWMVQTPGRRGMLRVDGKMVAEKLALSRRPGDWFALHGPGITLVEVMQVSPSLSTVKRHLLYRESATAVDPPESQPGEMPGIGYTLSQWNQVESGAHWFASNSYALPPDLDVREFLDTLTQPLRTAERVLPLDSAPALRAERAATTPPEPEAHEEGRARPRSSSVPR